MYGDLRYDTDGHAGIVTIARPEVRNALRRRTYQELEDVVRTSTDRVLLFTGEVVDVGRAARFGLVGRVVDDDQLMPSALEVAHRVAANPPLAVAALKNGLRRALDPDWTGLGSRVSETLGELFGTEDHREGVRSFLEKREPRYVGR